MSSAAYFVTFASVVTVMIDLSVVETADVQTAVYPNESLQYLNTLHEAIKLHDDSVMFLREMMKIDYVWKPILDEWVVVERIPFINQYDKSKSIEIKDEFKPLFEFILTMMSTNTFLESNVWPVMEALKSAMTCSVLKHVSFQGLSLHALLTKSDRTTLSDEQKIFNEWLLEMTEIAIDKLIAVDHSHNPKKPITQTHLLLINLRNTLLGNEDFEALKKTLNEIGSKMFDEINKTCKIPESVNGYYSTLITNLNKTNRVEEMEEHRTYLTENMRKSLEVKDLEMMLKQKGPIDIKENITAKEIFDLDDCMLKKATTANYNLMIFLYSNLPIKTWTDLQWKTLSKSKKSKQPEIPTNFSQTVE